jgi:nitroreductase
MDTIEAIKSRRSIRRYKPDNVDDHTLAAVLDAARWAPSWANTQCWRFIVVKDQNTKAELAATLAAGNPATKAMLTAPVVIVACAELKKSGYHSEGPSTVKGEWYMFDVALAMQNLSLAAHTLGLGTVNIGLFDVLKVESILNIPKGFTVVEMTPLGYRDTEGRNPGRKELNEIVFKEKFGENYQLPAV